MVQARRVSDHFPLFREQGMDYLVSATEAGVAIQIAEVAQAGAAPFAVTFAGLGLSAMADADYLVFVTGPNGDERADLTTRTTAGFSILGGADTEVLGIMVVGRVAGLVA